MTALQGDHSDGREVVTVIVDGSGRPPVTSVPAIVDDRAPWAPSTNCRYRGRRLVAKRILDLTVAVPMSIVAAPIVGALAIVVRLGSNGPAFYRQVRVGRNGRRFTIYKFRTMHVQAESHLRSDPDLWRRYVEGGFKLSLDEDPRVTRIGAVLRKTSLDELPQLLNVIRGDMSLVGPRPVIPEELEQYGNLLAAYLMATPGLTGAWQVAGRDAVRFPSRARLDADYVDRWSLLGDLGIILRTLPAALSGRDVR